jgi:hypothetical protein
MTIEIRQLVIRARVNPGHDVSASLPGGGITPNSLEPASADVSAGQAALLDNLVATCVRTVLRRLERSRDR